MIAIGPSRRTTLLAASTLLLASCHRDRSAARETGPVRGGTLVYATDREPICLDPHVAGDMPQVFIAEQYLDRLVSMDEQGGIGPWLARSWTISADGRTYTFHLRTDVTFTDGTPFNAAAVKANLDHMVNPATQSSTAGGYIRQYVGADILDPHTIAVHLSTPYAAFLEVLSQGFLGIESPAALRRPRDVNCQSPVGSGPFRIVRWDRQNEIVLVRNPAYNWAPPTARHQGPAYLERIEWKFIPEPSVRFSSLQAGEVDVIDNLPPEAEAAARRNPELTVLDADRPGSPTGGTLNTTRVPFNDRRVREAFIRAADVQGALDSVFFHEYRRAAAPLRPPTPFYDPRFDHVEDYDPARAARLLDAAGWTGRDPDGIRTRDGKRLVVHVPVLDTTAPSERTLWEQVQATTHAVGFDTKLEPGGLMDVLGRDGRWDYDVAIGYWNTNTADVLRIIFGSAFTKGVGIGGHHQNTSGFRNAAFDHVVEAALETNDSSRRRTLYEQAQAIVAANYLKLGTYPQSTRLGIYRAAHGVRVEPSLRITTLHDAWVTK